MLVGTFTRILASSAAALLLVIGMVSSASAQEAVSYKNDVKPILELRCLSCHKPGGDGYEKSGLDMRTYQSLMKGTKFGAVIKPRDAAESTLLAVVEHRTNPEIWMPHNKNQISKCERIMLRFWVMQGARDN